MEISKTNWEKVRTKYPEAKNARNLCAGWINSKDYSLEDIRLIDFVTYKVNGQERPKGKENIFFELEAKGTYPKTTCVNYNPTKSNVIEWLQYNFKHTIPDITTTLERDGFIDCMNQIFGLLTNPESSSYVDYELDGLVISSSDVIYHKSDYSYIYDECAFKFAAEEKETIINNIKWELSRTQRYVPVLEIEPVELSGATVHNVTGNNAKYLIENGLGVGALISVARSGEVIPKHMNTLEAADVDLPRYCPFCARTLVWDGVDLKCAYKNCPNIEYSDLRQWCECVGETDGLQWVLMKQYLDTYNITNIKELYDNKSIVLSDLNSRNLSITELKIKDFFMKLYTDKIDIQKILMGLNIPRLGDKTSKILSTRRDIVYSLFTYSIMPQICEDNRPWILNELQSTVKEATTDSIMSNLDKVQTIRYMYDYDEVKGEYSNCRIIYPNTTRNTEIKYIAVTGGLNTMKRKDFEKYISEYGYELSSNLKKCCYLITNTPDSGSSKNKDAQKYGIPIITEEQFLDTLK